MNEKNDKAGLIFKKIPDVMAEIEAIAKNRNNEKQGYKFRGIDDLYNELHPLLSKHRIFTVPKVLSETRSERSTNSGGVMFCVTMRIEYRFYAEDGSSVTAEMVGESMDTGDKASNKAMAIAHKYALLQIFAIPTEDPKDPENDSPVVLPRGKSTHVETSTMLHTKTATVSPAAPGPVKPNTTPRDREAANKILAKLYPTYLAKFPQTKFIDVLEKRYHVSEARDMTVDQLENLIEWMEDTLMGAPVAHPDARERTRTDIERDLIALSKELGWTDKHLDDQLFKKYKKPAGECSDSQLELAIAGIQKMKRGGK